MKLFCYITPVVLDNVFNNAQLLKIFDFLCAHIIDMIILLGFLKTKRLCDIPNMSLLLFWLFKLTFATVEFITTDLL